MDRENVSQGAEATGRSSGDDATTVSVRVNQHNRELLRQLRSYELVEWIWHLADEYFDEPTTSFAKEIKRRANMIMMDEPGRVGLQ